MSDPPQKKKRSHHKKVSSDDAPNVVQLSWTKIASLPSSVLTAICSAHARSTHGDHAELVKRVTKLKECLTMELNDLSREYSPTDAQSAALMHSRITLPSWLRPVKQHLVKLDQDIKNRSPLGTLHREALRGMAATGMRCALAETIPSTDETGDHLYCLRGRTDVRIFAACMSLFMHKGFGLDVAIWLAGFAHILYHTDSVTYCCGLMLANPHIHPAMKVASIDAQTTEALETIRMELEVFFGPLRIFRGQLVNPAMCQHGHSRIRFLMPCRNPSNWNRNGYEDFSLLIHDARSNRWGRASKALAREISACEKFSYHTCMNILLERELRLYTGKRKSYQSVHILRDVRFACEKPGADGVRDWLHLADMGAGVRNSLARYQTTEHEGALMLRNLMRQASWEKEYYLDDLACCMCLHDEHSSIACEMYRAALAR